MDRQQGSGLFGAYAPPDQSIGFPGIASANPYLNVDPAFLYGGGESDFIFPEGSSHKRGRFELMFSQIGGSVFAGGAVGGLNGLYSGFMETKTAQLTGAVRRTQMLNFVTKQGASTAQTLGVIALMYSLFGVLLSKTRGAEDELNTLIAGTATGVLFKSTAGWKKCLRGGAVGFSLAAVYTLITSRDRVKQMIGMD